jgi:hypothetical protein
VDVPGGEMAHQVVHRSFETPEPVKRHHRPSDYDDT